MTKIELAVRQAIHKINKATSLDEESDELLMEAVADLREALDHFAASGKVILTEEQAQQIEEALVDNIVGRSGRTPKTHEAIAIIRAALAEQEDGAVVKTCPDGYGTITTEQAKQEPSCNQHPDAPHGFARNASHNAGRYVCECEGWESEQAEREPCGHVLPDGTICWDRWCPDAGTLLYTHLVRTKDLTDDELYEFYESNKKFGVMCAFYEFEKIARAVIAADREKNRG